MTNFAICDDGCNNFDEPRTLARPWPRLWARILDIAIYLTPLGLCVGYLMPDFVMLPAFDGRGGSLLLGATLLPLAMLLDAVVLAVFGNSLGKSLVGIRVELADSERLDFGTTAKRNVLVWLKGVGLGIPIVALVQYTINFSKVNRGDLTSWDESLSTRVYDINSSLGRTVVAATICIALNIGGAVLDSMDAAEARRQPSSPEWGQYRQRPDPIAAELRDASTQVKRQQVDEITWLDRASAEARAITYHYTITRRDNTDQNFLLLQEEYLIQKVCEDEAMATAMANYGVIYQYSYSLPDSRRPLVVIVNYAKCRSIDA